MKFKINWDGLGIATSLACAIHCIVLPLVLTSLPLFGINIIHNVYFEWAMIIIAFAVGVYALVHGYHTHHKKPLPVILKDDILLLPGFTANNTLSSSPCDKITAPWLPKPPPVPVPPVG